MNDNLNEILKVLKETKEFLDKIHLEDNVIDLQNIEGLDSKYEDTIINSDNLIPTINENISKIIELLSLSVLTGEYIKNEKILGKLDDIIGRAKGLISFFVDFPLNIQTLLFGFSSLIKISIEIYKDFIYHIKNHYSDDRVSYILIQNKNLKREINEAELDENMIKHIKYFQNVINLSKTDHFPSNSNNHFIKLYSIKETIDDLKISEFNDLTNIINIKIRFLQHKWKERRFQENPLLSSYNEDGEEKLVENFNEECRKLQEWIGIFNTQYEVFSNNEHYISKRIRKYKNKKLKEITYLQIHQLIKYYKDIDLNKYKLEDIVDFLIKQQKQKIKSNNFYDRHVDKVFINYALNNLFSISIRNRTDIKEIESQYNEIEKKLFNINSNYFLDFKFLDKVTEILISEISKDKDVFISNYDEIVVKIKKVFKNYLNSIKWSRENLNYIFILPFEESLVPFEIKGKTYDVFFASSFVLPPSLNNIDEQYYNIKEKVEKVYNYIEFAKYFSKERNEINDIKDEMKNSQTKTIETIGLFTAVISFIFASIPSFKFVQNFGQALLFTGIIGATLFSMVGIIFLFTRGFKVIRSWILIILSLIVFLSTGYLLNNSTNKIYKKTEETYKIKIDSVINVFNKKLDSINKIKKPNP